MKERRVFERQETTYQTDVCDAATGRVVGLLSDISSGGMMLRTDEPLERGSVMHLKFDIPSTDQSLAVEAAVRWCEPDLDPEAHVVGMEFRGPTPPGSAVIEEIRRRLITGR